MRRPILDDPVIRACERSGWPTGLEPAAPVCPVCGAQCETIYRDMHGDISGCDECITQLNAWEMQECFPGKENE